MYRNGVFKIRRVCWIAAATAAYFVGFQIGGSVEEPSVRPLMTATKLQVELAKEGIKLQRQILSLQNAAREQDAVAARSHNAASHRKGPM